MTFRHYPNLAVIFAITCLGLISCSSGPGTNAFRSSFLPPVPTPPAEDTSTVHTSDSSNPPVLQASTAAYLRELPPVLRVQPRVRPRPQLDRLIRGADEHFQTGRKLYAAGEIDEARTEFDLAIDLLLSASEAAPDRPVMERKLAELVDRIHRLDVEGMGAAEPQQAQTEYDKAPIEEILELTFPIDPRIKDRVQSQVQATISQLPLEENDEVLRYVNYFSSERGRKTLIAGLRRQGRYHDMIRRILDEEGVPQELIFLAQAESGFMPRALSHKAAAGMWQFVKFRGNEYGLKQSAYYDDRLDPWKATRAGARHLRDLYHEFGDWYLAMAAYNCGPGCVSRAVQRTGYADFWELRCRNVLPRETSNYVPLILAMTIMAKNADDYGVDDVDPDPALVVDTLQVETSTSLNLVADLLDTSVTEIREINPALLKTIVPAGYELHVPKGATTRLIAGLKRVPPDKRLAWRAHRVVDGETADVVARHYRVTLANLESANPILGREIRDGDLVIVPAAEVRAPAKTSNSSARRHTASKSSSSKKVASKTSRSRSKSAASKKRASSGSRVASRTTRSRTAVR